MVHHIQSSLGIVQHIWFVSGQIWSSQGRRATHHHHGIEIMGWKSWNKKKVQDQNMELIGEKGDPPPPWNQNHGIKIKLKTRD